MANVVLTDRKHWIWDIEIYPTCFVIRFKNVDTGEHRIFQLSPISNDAVKLINFVRDETDTLIGFNSISFDYPLFHYFLTKVFKKEKITVKEKVNMIQQHAMILIREKKQWNNQIKHPVRNNVDLYKIHHFDNNAKRTSLKHLEFVLRMRNIEELPFKAGKDLNVQEIEKVIDYCGNDIEATHLFYIESLEAIEFRKRMSEIYDIDFTNANDVKIGELILIKAIEKQWGIPHEHIMQLRTRREQIPIKDIIFNYIRFESATLNRFLNWWKTKIIYQTKGQFSEIPLNEVVEIFDDTDKVLKKKDGQETLKKLNIIYKGFKFDLGTGGLHGIKNVGIWEATEDYIMELWDASSYYPNLAAMNMLAPLHFPPTIFVSVITMLYEQRMEGARNNDKQIVKAIKLALNGALYGKSNSEYSPMYDPQFMMTICLNGQLLLMMIAEQCLNQDIEVIQVNTDGVLVKYHKSKSASVAEIKERWSAMTKIKLGSDQFIKFVQRNVNNYLGIKTDGTIKRKGSFLIKKEYHQNHSQLVVAKALEDYYVKGTKPEEFIPKHALLNKNLYDFFKLAKVDRRARLEERIETTTVLQYPAKRGNRTKKYPINCIEHQRPLQSIMRYFIANEGFKMVKIMQPLKDKIFEREIEIEAGNLCIECNNLDNITPQQMRKNLNFKYYINECYKVINQIERGELVEEELDDVENMA